MTCLGSGINIEEKSVNSHLNTASILPSFPIVPSRCKALGKPWGLETAKVGLLLKLNASGKPRETKRGEGPERNG